MKYQDNMEAVARLQPDYMGFIFYDKSSRYFDGEIPKIPYGIKKVGVFVNSDLDYVLHMIKKHKLNSIQLHGNEDSHYCASLKFELHLIKEQWKQSVWEPYHERQGVNNYEKKEIIKVFSIKDEFNFNLLRPYEDIVDYFLFDTKGELPGGNGYTFNWDVLKDYPSTIPFFLSGGIGLNEVKNIKEFKKSSASKYCCAIDVNSKFEIEPGLKNINELEKFKHELQH